MGSRMSKHSLGGLRGWELCCRVISLPEGAVCSLLGLRKLGAGGQGRKPQATAKKWSLTLAACPGCCCVHWCCGSAWQRAPRPPASMMMERLPGEAMVSDSVP